MQGEMGRIKSIGGLTLAFRHGGPHFAKAGLPTDGQDIVNGLRRRRDGRGHETPKRKKGC
jgi:hypothetical protein